MTSAYTLTPASKTRCPGGHTNVHLLAHKDMDPGRPAFYICFDCRFVGEVGVGPVSQPSHRTPHVFTPSEFAPSTCSTCGKSEAYTPYHIEEKGQ